MSKIRFWIGLAAARMAIILLKITGHGGTNFPGQLAIRICPDFLKYIGKPDRIIAVTGTNGKTTVCNMILDGLKDRYTGIVNNRAGSNIDSGIATSLIRNADFAGNCKYKTGIFEIDERSVVKIFPFLKPEHLLVTNLSRDSIMRNAHPEYISKILTKHIPPTTKLVLNGDDMICSQIAPANPRVYFGIEEMEGDLKECHNLIQDFQICPLCHQMLKFSYLRYSHIGKTYCDNCGFKSPDYDYAGKVKDPEDMMVTIEDSEGSEEYLIPGPGVHTIYNVVAAVALLREMGYSGSETRDIISDIGIPESRYERRETGDKTIHLMLAKDKNAFAGSRVFEQIKNMEGTKEIIIMNSCRGDAVRWSENICWLYDCDFELLNDEDIVNIVVCGQREKDYVFRLLQAGISREKISFTEKETDTPEKLILPENDNIYILYGTDSIELGRKVADKTERIIKEHGGNQ